MKPSREQTYPQPYIDMCQHPAIQVLKPNTVHTNEVWIPTSEQLYELLNQKLPYPERSSFKRTTNEWEYQTYFREWADDYGTFIDTHRQFVGTHAESVLMQVLIALLGIEERWMV